MQSATRVEIHRTAPADGSTIAALLHQSFVNFEGSRHGSRLRSNDSASEGDSRLGLSPAPFLSSAMRRPERFGFRRVDQDLHEVFGPLRFTTEKAVGR
jgi:hypothetical protein